MRNIFLILLILTLFISIGYSQLSVKIVSPKNGETVSGNVIIKVEVSDPTNVSKVEFYINNEKVGEVTKSPFEYIWDTTFYLDGEYNIIVRVYEKTGFKTGVSINIKIDNNKGWQKIFGRSDDDEAYSIQQTNDGGYIVAGYTGDEDHKDIYIIKLDADGNIVWERTFGGSGDDGAYSIQQTNDGGYIVAGYTTSFGEGGKDVYIIKLDADGNKLWEKTFGGSDDDEAYSIQQTNDGGYIVAGYTGDEDHKDIYIIKLDADGNKVWERTFGGSGDDGAYSIQQTNDGGYIVAGETTSFGAGNNDVYIIKLNVNGNKVWERTYGRSGDDVAYSVQQTNDGGYIVAGYTGDEDHKDIYIIKLDVNRNKVWEKTFGGSDDDEAYSIQQTNDGGYIVAGYTTSFGEGGKDVYIIKLNANGYKVWQKTYSGSESDDIAYSVRQTNDGGYIVAGSYFYIIKMDADGNTGPFRR